MEGGVPVPTAAIRVAVAVAKEKEAGEGKGRYEAVCKFDVKWFKKRMKEFQVQRETVIMNILK